MRILLINTSDAGGGAQEVGAQLLRGLRSRGHDVRLAVGHRQTDDPGVEVLPNADRRPPMARFAERIAGHVAARGGARAAAPSRLIAKVGEPRRWARERLGYEDFAFPATWDLVDEPGPGPDVIHGHNLHGGYFDLRALPALSRRAPFVLTLHDAWALSGHCAHSFECERWRTGCGDCPHLDVPPAVPRDRTAANWRLKRSIYQHSRLHVVTPCHWLRRRVEASILAEGLIDTRVVPQGVDLELFTPGRRSAARRELGLPEDADVVAFVANSTRSNHFKDFPTLQRVIDELGARPTARPLILASIGESGPTRRVGDAELRMIGHLGSPAAVAPWYQAADVYIHPARADTFPTTVLEAQACGTPVVASAVGGIPEQLEDGVTGHLTPAGDARSMTAALTALLDDASLRASFSAAARARAVRHFDLERFVSVTEAWYRELAADDAERYAMSHS